MDSEGGLGGTSADVFGPLAVALIGYHPEEFETFRSFMIDMEADMVKVRRSACLCKARFTDIALFAALVQYLLPKFYLSACEYSNGACSRLEVLQPSLVSC